MEIIKGLFTRNFLLNLMLLIVVLLYTYKLLKWSTTLPQVWTMSLKVSHHHNVELEEEPPLSRFKLTLRRKGGSKQRSFLSGRKNASLEITEVNVQPKICDIPVSVEQLLRPCKKFIAWDKRQKNNSQQRTDTKNSFIRVDIYKSVSTNLHIGKVHIETYDRKAMKKRVGGDSWRSIVTGEEQQFSVELKDLSDGLSLIHI